MSKREQREWFGRVMKAIYAEMDAAAERGLYSVVIHSKFNYGEPAESPRSYSLTPGNLRDAATTLANDGFSVLNLIEGEHFEVNWGRPACK